MSDYVIAEEEEIRKAFADKDAEIEWLKAELTAYKEQQTEDIKRLGEWQKLIRELAEALKMARWERDDWDMADSLQKRAKEATQTNPHP